MQEEYKELAAFTERANKIAPYKDDLKRIIVNQIEYTRKKHGLTRLDYASLLDVSKSCYDKMLRRNNIPLQGFVRYCIVFGFDISSTLQNLTFENQSEPFKEFSVLLAGCSAETLEDIKSVLTNASESNTHKQRMVKALDAVISDKK